MKIKTFSLLKNYALKLILISIFFLFFRISSSFAVTETEGAPSQRWVCLSAAFCAHNGLIYDGGRWVSNDVDLDCRGRREVPGMGIVLRTKKETKPLPNKDTYIVQCVATSNGQICTTGNKKADMFVYGKDNQEELKKVTIQQYGKTVTGAFVFQAMYTLSPWAEAANPTKSNAKGEVGPFAWYSENTYYDTEKMMKFLALNLIPPVKKVEISGKGGQQQDTFTFEDASNSKSCTVIDWDPYGRIFDNQSLEPVPNASVQLLKKRPNGVFTLLSPDEVLGGAVQNPQVTKEDGAFSFVVPDATYRLQILAPSYIFPTNVQLLNPNYKNIYSDIYPGITGEDIVQKGIIQHRDIPLYSSSPGSFPVKLIEYFYSLDKETNTAIIEGKTSHPFTTIRLYTLKPGGSSVSVTRYYLAKTISSDKMGRFHVEINQTQFEPTEYFGDLELEKTHLGKKTTSLMEFFPSVKATESNTASIRFEPMLNTIKGYAINRTGNNLSKAKIGIYLDFSNKPYYETVADEKGYYQIDYQNLPSMPYHLIYTAGTGEKYSTTTSKFLAQNNDYFKKNNIHLNALTKNQIKNIQINNNQKSAIKSPSTFSNKFQNNSRFLLIVAVVLILLTGGAIGLLIVYFLNKRRRNTS